jgi:hypothetical protein
VHAQEGEGAQIGLQAGTATGVRPGDGEHPYRGLARLRQRQEIHDALPSDNDLHS